MVNARTYLIVSSIVVLVLLASSILFFQHNAYLLVSFVIIACTMIPFFARFEIRKITGREVVILAILAAIAAVSRVPFAGFPSVQPTSFVIIVTGLVFGAESGFMVGAIAAIVSNFFLGQGPWTPWQMYGWGMMGMMAGLLRNTWWMKKMWGKLIFGFIWGYLFGWFMNAWIVVSNIENMTWEFFISIFVGSIYFDLAHGLSNVFFILIFSTSWIKIMNRFKKKYGLLVSS